MQTSSKSHPWRVCVGTFGLNGERHVMSRVISLPEVSEPLVGVDLLLFGIVL